MSVPPKKKSGGLSLYADLLEPEKQKAAGATISGAPVKYDIQKSGGADEDAQKKKDASLKFQPIKRPQAQQKTKSKPASSSSAHKFSSSTATAVSASSPPNKKLPSGTPHQQPSVQKTNFEDWIGDEDDEYYYYQQQDARQKYERGGRKNKKKNKPRERTWDWDDIYDPTLPNNYADYKGSQEQIREVRDWKARLYYHQMTEAKKDKKNGVRVGDAEEEERPRPTNMMFAPPSNLSFAPPSMDDNKPSRLQVDDDDGYYPSTKAERGPLQPQVPAPGFAQSSTPDDATGEDAYMRRMQMSGMAPTQSASPAAHPNMPPMPMPPPPPATAAAETPDTNMETRRADTDMEARRAQAQAKIAAFKAKLQKQTPKPDASTMSIPPPPATNDAVATPPVAVQPSDSSPAQQPPAPPPPPPPEPSGSTISRAPVRYQVPAPPTELQASEDQPMKDVSEDISEGQAKSNRPGKKGFAERLLKKYGWEKGQGLGAKGEGITTAIVAKAEKRKKRPDAEGGGWAAPANMGKLVGGKKRKVDNDDDSAEPSMSDPRFGKMSEVIKLEGMLDGLDVQKEIEENNLMQEIGDEMGTQYGNVERVFIWRREMGGGNEVFVKFTSQLSALRAVNAMDATTFAENEVKARFWDAEMFEKGEYA